VHVYGARGGDPVIVSSGDGGWMHLGPHVAETLAAHGYFVVGFNVKTYLSGVTSDGHVLRVEDVPGDYGALLEYAARGSPVRPILIGVSEGAGLSVLVAGGYRRIFHK
jgi:type IV secretory pathway VirJ component